MRWILTGCLLGGLGALLKHWHSPYAIGVGIAGFSLLMVGVFRWLSTFGGGGRQSGNASGSLGGYSGGGIDIGDAGCDGGGCDGGGGD